MNGSFDSSQQKGGWGAIGRDQDNNLVFAAAGAIPYTSEALHTEIQALVHGIKIAENMGIGRPMFVSESDCMGVCNPVNEE